MQRPAQDHRDHDVAYRRGEEPYDGDGFERREVRQGLHPQKFDRAAQRPSYGEASVQFEDMCVKGLPSVPTPKKQMRPESQMLSVMMWMRLAKKKCVAHVIMP